MDTGGDGHKRSVRNRFRLPEVNTTARPNFIEAKSVGSLDIGKRANW